MAADHGSEPQQGNIGLGNLGSSSQVSLLKPQFLQAVRDHQSYVHLGFPFR